MSGDDASATARETQDDGNGAARCAARCGKAKKNNLDAASHLGQPAHKEAPVATHGTGAFLAHRVDLIARRALLAAYK